ncbi:MAG: nucleotide exchange factor GrpE [Candidatus Hydrogenedentes bacterium]|nr:nucleotide exchange factor GrpE [Candidatus Hydrogenedentota bacterium]
MTINNEQETELERKLRAEIDAEDAEADAAHSLETSAPQPDGSPVESEEEASPVETLDPLEALEAEAGELKDQLLRGRAEFDNYRKRSAREVERIRKTASESLIHDLLPVIDNLELALDHTQNASGPLADGVKMVLEQLLEVLARNGLEPIEALGQPFDPNVHEAVSQVESEEVPKDKVAKEFQRGYKLGGQILRPSKVVVSLGDDEEQASD